MRKYRPPEEMLEWVVDRDTFFAFVESLIDDREDSVAQERVNPSNPYGPDANGWDNIYIETFFEAALSCAEDSGNVSEEPSWRTFAEFLYGGKVYEQTVFAVYTTWLDFKPTGNLNMSRQTYLQSLLSFLNGSEPEDVRGFMHREEAYNTLKALTGQDFGYDVKQWRNWFKNHPVSTNHKPSLDTKENR